MRQISLHAHRILGLTIALFAATILFCWVFRIEALARWIPGAEQMALNAQLMFLSAGLFCTLFPTQQARVHVVLKICIGLLLLLPGLTLLQYLFGINLGIDFVRVPRTATALNPYPGRMSPNTALAFLCAGIALLLLSYPPGKHRRDRLAGMAIGLTMLIGFTALAGYFMRLDVLYHITSFNKMLVPTAAGMSVLGCCLWLLRQHLHHPQSRSTSSYQRRLLWRAGTVLMFVALAAGVAGFAVVRNVLEKALSDNIMFATTTNATAMANLLEGRLAFQHTVVTRPVVQEQFTQLAHNSKNRQVRHFLQDMTNNLLTAGISGARILDKQGQQIATSGVLLRGRVPLAHNLGKHGQHQVYLLWQDRYLLAAETPIIAAGQRVGTLITEQPLPSFDRLLQVIRSDGDSTDALLCSREKETVLCGPSRLHFGITHLTQNVDSPIRRALNGERGVINTVDMRKISVFAAYTQLPNFDLGFVIKIDSDSMYAPLKEQTQLLIALLIALVVLGTAAMNFAVRPLLTRIERDISDLRNAEEKFASSEKRLRAITDNLPVLISYIDRNNTYRFVNQTFAAWTGILPEQALGRDVAEVLGEEKYLARREYIARSLAGERVEFNITTPGVGSVRQLSTTYIPDIAEDGSVAGIYTLSADITALHKAQQQLQTMARFDALTGLPNRYQMQEKLIEAIARCRRSGTPMAVMFLDLDHFKTINDNLGHAAGDAVLQEFGRRLKASVRETDTVCRLAGDEFVIILESLENVAAIESIAKKILANVSAPCEIQAKALRISTSIGIAYCQGQPLLPDALVDQADQALYQAKQTERGTFRIVLC